MGRLAPDQPEWVEEREAARACICAEHAPTRLHPRAVGSLPARSEPPAGAGDRRAGRGDRAGLAAAMRGNSASIVLHPSCWRWKGCRRWSKMPRGASAAGSSASTAGCRASADRDPPATSWRKWPPPAAEYRSPPAGDLPRSAAAVLPGHPGLPGGGPRLAGLAWPPGPRPVAVLPGGPGRRAHHPAAGAAADRGAVPAAQREYPRWAGDRGDGRRARRARARPDQPALVPVPGGAAPHPAGLPHRGHLLAPGHAGGPESRWRST